MHQDLKAVEEKAARSLENYFVCVRVPGRSFMRSLVCVGLPGRLVALLALMGEHLDRLSPAEQEEDVQTRFHEALISNTIASLPFPISTPNNPTFALECSLSDTVLKWAEHQIEEQQNGLRQLVGTSRALGTNDGVCNALRKLGESSLADQVAVCLALKAKAYFSMLFTPALRLTRLVRSADCSEVNRRPSSSNSPRNIGT